MALSPPPLEREQLVGSTAVPELPANTTNNPWADAVTALVAAMRDAVSDERRRAVADLVKVGSSIYMGTWLCAAAR